MKRILSATALAANLAVGPGHAAPLPDHRLSLCQILYDAGQLYLKQGRLEGVKRTIDMMGIVQTGCHDEASKLKRGLDALRKRRELEDAPQPAPKPTPGGNNRIVPTRG